MFWNSIKCGLLALCTAASLIPSSYSVNRNVKYDPEPCGTVAQDMADDISGAACAPDADTSGSDLQEMFLKGSEEIMNAYNDLTPWDRSVLLVELTGDKARDVIAIGQSNLGYEEEQYGYTIYGDWGGLPHADWCGLFASFCLTYAGVDDVPLSFECNNWMKLLQERDMFRSRDENYVPSKGDLIFFDYGRRGFPNHVGIVEDVVDGWVLTVEGNHLDAVAECQYKPDYFAIFGYGELKLAEK